MFASRRSRSGAWRSITGSLLWRIMRQLSPFSCRPAIVAGAVLFVIFLLGTVGVAAADAATPLTTVAAIRHLTPQEAERGLPVKLRGVISYNAPGFWQLFI